MSHKIFIIFVMTLAFIVTRAAPKRRPKVTVTDEERQKFQAWKQRHQKVYKSQADENRAMLNMVKNLREIHAHNQLYEAGKVTFSRATWEYSDLSYDEKSALLVGQKPVAVEIKSESLQMATKFQAAPDEVNWVKSGLVNAVQNQGKCGSCWTYAAVGVAEAVLLKNGTSTRLSTQNLVDCSKNGGSAGCGGGFTQSALKYIASNGIAAMEDYPYTGRGGKCRASSVKKVKLKLGAVKYEKLRGNENRLKEIVANVGPVAVAVRAADSFMNYKSGVYNNPKCSKDLDHAVLIVGYGRDVKTKMDYWLVKNSWGTSWGEKGFVRMARNRKSQCGIATEVSYVV